MRVERALLEELSEKVFNIGYHGELNHTQVIISCPVMFRDYPDAVASMILKPPQGDLYPVSLTRDGNDLTWDVSAADVAIPGAGILQLTFTDGEGEEAEIIKTVYGAYSVNASLVANGEAPDPVQSWLDEAGAALATFENEIGDIRKITTATDADEGKALSPKTVTNGKVTEWEYIDLADPDVVTQAVDDWLDDHPEATTTVEDGAITEAKLNDSLKEDLAWQDDVDELKSAITQEKAPVILDNASGAIATVSDGADNLPVKTLTVAIEPVQSGSGDPSPSNVRHISGWTAAEVVRTGFNQWDEEWETGIINGSGATTPADNAIRSKNFFECLPNTTYYMTCGKTDGGTNNKYYLGMIFYDENKNFTHLTYNNNGTVTTNANDYYFKITTNTSTVVYGGTYNDDICINLSNPNRNGQYEPYHATQTKTYPFPSQAGTVYGGTLTVNADGTGKLVVTHTKHIFDGTDDGWQSVGTDVSYITMSDMKSGSWYSDEKTLCDKLKKNANNSGLGVRVGANGTAIYFNGFATAYGISSLSDWNTWLAENPVSVTYPLATPVVYNLTALEVIELLKGTNNLWADCGDTTIEYPADTKLYIDKKIAELQALILEN